MSDHEHHGVGHLVPIRYLVATGMALLVLTVLTVWIAQYHFGAANVWVALGIAVVKASLVVLFFMHLRWDRPFNSLVFITSIAFVALFISLALTDTLEYKPDIMQGNAKNVQAQIDQLPARIAERDAMYGTGHGGGHAPAPGTAGDGGGHNTPKHE